jgi:hypothetical protein
MTLEGSRVAGSEVFDIMLIASVASVGFSGREGDKRPDI